MLKILGKVCSHQLAKKEKVYLSIFKRSCLHLQEPCGRPCAVLQGTSTSSHWLAAVPQPFYPWLLAAFILGHHGSKLSPFPVENYADAFKQSKHSTHTQSYMGMLRPTCTLPNAWEDVHAEGAQASDESGWVGKWEGGHWPFHQWSNQEDDSEGLNLPAISPWYCPESSAWLMLLHLLTIVRTGVQTHSRASLFHRKNTCHLYQMAMDFQHKQYFHNTIVNSNHLFFSKRDSFKEKDS